MIVLRGAPQHGKGSAATTRQSYCQTWTPLMLTMVFTFRLCICFLAMDLLAIAEANPMEYLYVC